MIEAVAVYQPIEPLSRSGSLTELVGVESSDKGSATSNSEIEESKEDFETPSGEEIVISSAIEAPAEDNIEEKEKEKEGKKTE